jgi:preprotein translocase subunit Sec63
MGKLLLALAIVGIVFLWWSGRARNARRMAPADARRLLGLGEGASLEEIRAAHRRLIAKVHPDTGGSADLAERVNLARDTLVAEMNRGTPRAS